MVSTSDTGGRPTRQFCLIEFDETPVDLDDLDGCVNVDESEDGLGSYQFDDDDQQPADFEDAVDFNKLDDLDDWTRSHAG